MVALLGLFMCPFFAIAAWGLGRDHQRRMRACRRPADPVAEVGRVLGMLVTLGWCTLFGLFSMSAYIGVIGEWLSNSPR